MIHYRIAKDSCQKPDLVINKTCDYLSLYKLKEGFEHLNPIDAGIRHLNDRQMYAFKNIDALMTFLFTIAKFDSEDLKELQSLGYKLWAIDLDVYGSAFSVFYASFFDDEVISAEEYSLDCLLDEYGEIKPYNIIIQKKPTYHGEEIDFRNSFK